MADGIHETVGSTVAKAKRLPRMLKLKEKVTTYFAYFLIFLMALSDWYTVRDLFISVNTNSMDAIVYATVAAIVLEMLPSYMGTVMGRRRDKGRYDSNDAGWVSVVVALLVTCGMAILVGYLRFHWLQEQIRLGEIGGRRGNEEIYGQYFLMVLPALTSLAAFLISWFMLRERCLQTKYEEVLSLQEDYYEKERDFRMAHSRCLEARTTVWISVCDQDESDMPEGLEAFRRECFARIRNKLVDNCLTTYPTQIERYTADVEAKLQSYLLEISKHSTLPYTITSISLDDLIREHDKNAMDYADCWNYNWSGPDLEAELRRTIDNAVVIAQYKSALNPYYLEKER